MPKHESGREKYILQYAAWGVVVQTSQVRGAHIANGIAQLLRLFPQRVNWSSEGFDPSDYERSVTSALDTRFVGDSTWKLSDASRALCVTTTKEGPLSLAGGDEEPAFFTEGRAHVARFLDLMGLPPEKVGEVHATFAAALNADGRVYASGGSDPTTSSLAFAGYSSPQTLAGMHAATFMGLLCSTPKGAAAVRRLYDALRREDDPHSQLVRALQLNVAVGGATAGDFDEFYPMPSGPGWTEVARVAAILATRLLARHEHAANKADMLMAFVDLASLLLFLRLIQWRPASASGQRPLLLMYAPARRRPSEAISRAQQNLRALCAMLDHYAEQEELLIEKGRGSKRKVARKGQPEYYLPSVHAKNLGAAGGWLFPLDARGAPKRWFCPGPRQLQTLVHSLVEPGEELAWTQFANRAHEELGLVFGGVSEAKMAAELGLGGGANSVREAGQYNREHLVALGLARQESDNVILVDGGGK